jgi:hypothetical protein
VEGNAETAEQGGVIESRLIKVAGDMKYIYLNHRVIMPGDILVSRQRSILSRVVRWQTKGKFSHAALFVAPTLLFESKRDGIFQTPLNFACFKDDRGSIHFGLHLPHVSGAKVLRHDSIERRLQTDYYRLQDLFLRISSKHFGKRYSELIRLLCALPKGNSLRRVGDLYTKRLAKNSLRETDGRLFCSELIAAEYEKLRVRLFTIKTRPVSVSPVALATSSELREVTNAVLRGSPRECPDNQRIIKEDWQTHQVSRKAQVATTHKMKRRQTDAEETIKSMNRSRK